MFTLTVQIWVKIIMKMFNRWFIPAILLLFSLSTYADDRHDSSSVVYQQKVNKPVLEIYDKLYKSLEDARFFVVFEPNIGNNLARFSEKWGDDYNRNKLSEIRVMVFCNGWYANKVSNLDPEMLGFCPLHITLIEREGESTVLFNRLGEIAKNSPAKEILMKIESEVIVAIQHGLQ